MTTTKTYARFRLICLAGILVSAYATYVKIRAEQDDSYTALCDVAPKISCTTIFKSYFGRGFGLSQYIMGVANHLNPSNGIIGLLFYGMLWFSSYFHRYWICLLQLFFAILSNLLSLYLAYLLFFVLNEYCLICFLIYLVNKFLLIETWLIYSNHWRRKFEKKHSTKND